MHSPKRIYILVVHPVMNHYVVTYLLKARTVEPEKEPLLGNARTQQ
jgi:hypothetical protein